SSPHVNSRSSMRVSSRTSRHAAAIGSSPGSTTPFGKSQFRYARSIRNNQSTDPRRRTTTPAESRCSRLFPDSCLSAAMGADYTDVSDPLRLRIHHAARPFLHDLRQPDRLRQYLLRIEVSRADLRLIEVLPRRPPPRGGNRGRLRKQPTAGHQPAESEIR